MALTANHVQGVFGEFKPVIDSAGGTLTVNQIQGVFGEFQPVLDNAQVIVGGSSSLKKLSSVAQASIKKYSGVSEASLKKISGVTNP